MTDAVRRRDVLAGLASASGAALAGCAEQTEEQLEFECRDEPVAAASVEVDPNDWTTPRGDAANTGVNTEIDPPTPSGANGYRIESLRGGGGSISDPVVADGTVFATTTNRTWAIDGAADGHYWFVTEAGSQPILIEDVLAYGTQEEIVVLETGTGCSRWEANVSGDGPSIVAREGTIYSVTESALQAWTVEDGTEQWSASISESTYPEIAATDSALFVVGETEVLSFDLDGERRWRTSDVPPLYTGYGPTIAGDRVYVVLKDGGLLALDAIDGTERWRNPVAEAWKSRPAATATDVYVVDDQEGVVKNFAAEDGGERWSYTSDPIRRRTAPTIAGDTLFVPDAGRFDPRTGERFGPFEMSGEFAAFADDGIYYVQDGGETSELFRLS